MTQWYLLKDSSGKKSVSYTMMVTTFIICTVWLLLSIFENIGGWDVREFSAEAASLWFGPICGLYFGRRWQDAQKFARMEDVVPAPSSGSSTSATEEEKV